MYIHLHSHVLGNMFCCYFFIKVFFWVDAWFSDVFTASLRATQTTDSSKICTFLKG